MKRLHILATAVLAVLALVACAGQSDPAAEREALLQADRDFAIETAERGGDGWADWFKKDGVMFPSTGKVAGRDAIRERMRPVFKPDNARLLWEPSHAVVASSGELGYTIGRWRAVVTAAAGADSVIGTGNYVSIWEKDPEEGWRVAVDIGNDDPPAEKD